MTYILAIGIAPSWFGQTDSGFYMKESRSEAEVELGIKKLYEDMNSFKETTIRLLQVRPGEDQDWDELGVALAARHWDGVSIGGGLRRHPDLSDYFTQLMQLAIKTNPEATFLFPLTPTDAGPAIRKHMPSAM